MAPGPFGLPNICAIREIIADDVVRDCNFHIVAQWADWESPVGGNRRYHCVIESHGQLGGKSTGRQVRGAWQIASGN